MTQLTIIDKRHNTDNTTPSLRGVINICDSLSIFIMNYFKISIIIDRYTVTDNINNLISKNTIFLCDHPLLQVYFI